MKLANIMSDWIKERVDHAKKSGIIVGLSGGIDSAVTAVLSKRALGDNVIALILPCESHPKDEELALKVAKKFGIRVKKINLTQVHNKLCCTLPGANRVAKANLKPRLRMMTLYYLANSLNYLVAGTGNKSEIMIGYFTKYGDGGCDILPLGGLLKKEVRKLAQELRIPAKIIQRAPSAGLWEGQTDEQEIGLSYEELDNCLEALEKGKAPRLDDKKLAKIESMIKNSKHKRDNIPVFEKK
jgi:NAD+ synthase